MKLLASMSLVLSTTRAFCRPSGSRSVLASSKLATTATLSITERMRVESERELAILAEHYAQKDSSPIVWTSAEEASRFVREEIDSVLFDCDGVVYRSPDQAPDASACVQSLLDQGKKVFFVTNNAAANRKQLKEKLTGILGIDGLTEDMMVSSSYSMAQYLKKQILDTKGSGRLYVIGSQGLCEELRQTGFNVMGGPSVEGDKSSMTRDELASYEFPEHPIDAVVVGHDTDFNFRKMCIANVLLQWNPEAPLMATNEDSFDLVGADARHIAGNGCVVRALEYSSKRTAINTGKPSKKLSELIAEVHGIDPSRSLFVGDRLDTDIRFGNDSGMYSLLVMTGVTSAQQMIDLGEGTEREPLPSIITSHIGLMK